MYPTSVPTHSAEMGTSFSTTTSTLTTGTGAGPAARDVSLHPAPPIAAATTSAASNAGAVSGARAEPMLQIPYLISRASLSRALRHVSGNYGAVDRDLHGLLFQRFP